LETLIECDCGWSCCGSEEELIEACTTHARDVHGMELSREQILAVARPVDADDEGASAR
jgi:predicted small metal-binding protein